MGRPSTVTKANIDTLVECIVTGVPLRWAAARAGIERDAIYKFYKRTSGFLKEMREGREFEDLPAGQQEQIECRIILDAAKAQAVANFMRAVANSSESDWRAAAWALEKIDPKAFGKHRTELKELEERIKEMEKQVKNKRKQG